MLPLTIKKLYVRGNKIEGTLTAICLEALEELTEVDLGENPMINEIEREGVNSKIFILYQLRELRISKVNGEPITQQEASIIQQLSNNINPEILKYPEEVPHLLAFLAEKIPSKRLKGTPYVR